MAPHVDWVQCVMCNCNYAYSKWWGVSTSKHQTVLYVAYLEDSPYSHEAVLCQCCWWQSSLTPCFILQTAAENTFCLPLLITIFLLPALTNCFIFRSFQELSLKSSDLVYLNSKVSLHWLRGHLKHGASGTFPKDVVEIVVSGPSRWAGQYTAGCGQ